MTNSNRLKTMLPDVPNSEDFTKVLGQATWLMTVSPKHKELPVSWVEAHVAAPLVFKQVRVFTKGKQPIAVLIWAYTSAEVARKIADGGHLMSLQEWRSGPEVMVFDCISPFGDAKVFVEQFMAEVSAAKRKGAH